MKLQFFTIEIDEKCYDLPKDMPIPQKGSVVFVDGKSAIVEEIHYHINEAKLFMISIYAKPTK